MNELEAKDLNGKKRITGRRLLEFLKTQPDSVLDKAIYICDEDAWPMAVSDIRPICDEDDIWLKGTREDILNGLIFFMY